MLPYTVSCMRLTASSKTLPLILKKSIVYLHAFQWQLISCLTSNSEKQDGGRLSGNVFASRHNLGKASVWWSRPVVITQFWPWAAVGAKLPSKAWLLSTVCCLAGAPVGRLYEGVFHKLPITQTQHCHHVLLFSLFIVYTSMVDCTRKTVNSVLPFLLAESKVRGNAKKKGRF